MYIISQFSRITGLTVKALRYYDEQNILKPSHRDQENNYRYYDENDLKKANLIKLLRSLDFSIAEIKETLENVHNEQDLMCILQEKTHFIEKNILKEKQLIQKINAQIKFTDPDQHFPAYQIIQENIEPVLVATLRFVGQYTELDHYVPLLYKTVKSRINGNYFNCYFDEDCAEQATIELCVPIKEKIVDQTIECKILPGINALTTIHNGSYETISFAYKSLLEYANDHHLKLLIPSREVYLKGPGMIFKGNPDNYKTKIIIPYQEETDDEA